MSTPSDPQTPGTGSAQPVTKEIPVVPPASARTTVQQLPPPSSPSPSPSAGSAPQPAPATAAQPTGPVDFVPGPPGAGSSPPPAPPVQPIRADQPEGSSWPEILDAGEAGDDDAGAAQESKASRDRVALAGAGLVVLSLLLLELGLSLRFGTVSAWSAIPLWSAFATACVVLGLAASAGLVPAGRRLRGRTGWRIAAGGLVGLTVFWVLVVLPNADSDRGFLLTAALGALGGALWLTTGRDDRAASGADR
ncbi:hypothetical protein ABC795_00295 [Blastococcus sp. HT6-30]|uniref:hypothetical protein n=1 Tax=Blastococcus sp. HT6-30 TaxID=3144843 RepID=UPI00321BB3E7